MTVALKRGSFPNCFGVLTSQSSLIIDGWNVAWLWLMIIKDDEGWLWSRLCILWWYWWSLWLSFWLNVIVFHEPQNVWKSWAIKNKNLLSHRPSTSWFIAPKSGILRSLGSRSLNCLKPLIHGFEWSNCGWFVLDFTSWNSCMPSRYM